MSPINSFFFTYVTSAKIRFAILSIENKSSHIWNYPPKIIKTLEPLLYPLLAFLVNKSLNTGVFKKSLKIAAVIPIHKTEDRKNVSNYRPISILPLMSNFFEKNSI